jgi:selenide,water dikinase
MDDAGVYRISDNVALISTVDVFPPILDDPYLYGQVVVANCLSDCYAMGARPLFALNIVGFPAGKLPSDVMVEFLKGGADKMREAGIACIGGHSFKDDEIKYGIAVTGVVHPDQIVRNCCAVGGDKVVLTKPLGSGVISTAVRADKAPRGMAERLGAVMAELNKAASEVMVEVGVSACTDVTGFGLLGHLHEMVAGQDCSIRVWAGKVPLVDGAIWCAENGFVPAGSQKNMSFVLPKMTFAPGVPEVTRILLADAQTSGGLLMTVAPGKAEFLLDKLKAAGVRDAAIIGEVLPKADFEIEVVP